MTTVPEQLTNNQRLRAIVEQSGLSQPVALTIFNRGLGAAAYSMDSWKAFLASPETRRFRALKDELLVHAETVFADVLKKAA